MTCCYIELDSKTLTQCSVLDAATAANQQHPS